ncbi:hypothetical protein AKJ43_03745 [candidate division MSBL1 archaeon SCGC-AAA261D19]|uniref:Uncharacterized protein n=1 Tax=candidate division MSBL1 archaeon SCGC-AAA261D19 TaxID=1698273 RepID=A0A133V3J0_9EURY|nr:hypothetical protein AKJ43_03745 [candidate division MSBL1 archaeon SCGC-AAA261D19]
MRYALIFGAVSSIIILPFLDGFMFSLNFQASRPPAGMTPFAVYPAFEQLGLISESAMNQLEYITLPL